MRSCKRSRAHFARPTAPSERQFPWHVGHSKSQAGNWLSASQYGGIGSTLLNVDAGTELRMLASIITWYGSGNGTKISQGHCMLERVREKV